MSRLAPAARWLAVAIGIAAVIDPSLPVPGRQAAALRIIPNGGVDASRVADVITAAGFRLDATEAPAATVLVADRLPEGESLSPLPRPTWIVNTAPTAPNVRVVSVAAPSSRLPGQAVDVTVVVRAEGLKGKSTELTLEDGELPVAAASHTWAADEESWRATLQYLPPYAGIGRLRVTANAITGATGEEDNSADVLVPAARGPVRVLVFEAAVTWPALFVRRALEGESAFAVASTQRAAKSVVTRAGGPPPVLTRESLEPYEVVLVGGPGNLRPADVAALRWFVEQRGGVAAFVPDERPSGEYLQLTGVAAFDVATLEEPVRLGAGLLASEMAVPRSLPAGATVLAADPQRRPVIFTSRRGAGAVIVSGALDSWRHRVADDEAFARFWRQTIAAAAATVPPAVQMSIEPAIARPGDPIRISVRLRETELPDSDGASVTMNARAIDPQAKEEVPIRVWPTAEPSVFSGEWRAPQAGTFNVSVVANGVRADAVVMAAPDALAANAATPGDFERLARAHGGRAFPASRVNEMVSALETTHPRVWAVRQGHPMRSAWWCVPFAALLCGEWAIRRKRGRS